MRKSFVGILLNICLEPKMIKMMCKALAYKARDPGSIPGRGFVSIFANETQQLYNDVQYVRLKIMEQTSMIISEM